MKLPFFIKLRIPLLVILGFLFMILPYTSEAETNQELPKVSLKMFIVPELEACPPNGYKDYDSGQASNCPTLSREDVEKWEDKGITIQSCKIPPGEISLGKFLFTALDAYCREPQKNNPEERLSFVLVFEWDEPQNLPITLERRGDPNIPSMKWPGKLNNHTMWIHHERADAFLPANNIKWTLKEGNFKWIFKAER
jgi:hypothetical protein